MNTKIGLLGRKIGMTQRFTEEGKRIVMTVLQVGPCPVLSVKTKERHGYDALQLGFEYVAKDSKVKRAQLGQAKAAGVSPVRHSKEFRLADPISVEVGQEVTVGIFQAGDWVDVTGTSKGKGFQGGMRRWGWSSGPATHGSMSHRRVGSIGASSTPSRVVKGHHLPGHMGAAQVTTQSLLVVGVDESKSLLMVKGSVPGPEMGVVVVKKAIKRTSSEAVFKPAEAAVVTDAGTAENAGPDAKSADEKAA